MKAWIVGGLLILLAVVAVVVVVMREDEDSLRRLTGPDYVPGQPTIHAAASAGAIYDVYYYVTHGIGVNTRDGEGETPLHKAARANELYMVSYLLEIGAQPSVSSDRDVISDPMEVALKEGNFEAARILHERGYPYPLARAIAHGDVGHVRTLLTRDPGSVVTRPPQTPPILDAVAAGNPEVIKVLIDAGADPSEPTLSGYTPLLLAVTRENLPVATLLLDEGASPDIADQDGRTPLRSAIEKGKIGRAHV